METIQVAQASPTPTPIHRLPPQVLGDIFRNCERTGWSIEDAEYEGSAISVVTPRVPLNIRQVCTRWRDVVHERKEFWNQLFVHLRQTPSASNSTLTSLKDVIDGPWTESDIENWVGPLLELQIIVYLDTRYDFPPPLPRTLGIPQVVQPLGKIICSLILTDVSPVHLAVLEEGSFPALGELILTSRMEETFMDQLKCGRPRVVAFKNAPLKKLSMHRIWIDHSLRTIQIDSSPQECMPLPWGELQVFEERWSCSYENNESQFVDKCLQKCTSLVQLSINLCRSDVLLPEMRGQPLASTLPFLRKLTLWLYQGDQAPDSGTFVIPDFKLWQAFQLPSLTNLCIRCAPGIDFVPRFGSYPPKEVREKLEYLTLETMGGANARAFLEELPHVRELSLCARSFFPSPISDDRSADGRNAALDCLRDDEDPEKVILPQLQFVNLEYPREAGDYNTVLKRVLSILAEVLDYTSSQERSEVGPKRAHVELVGLLVLTPEFDQQQLERMLLCLREMGKKRDARARLGQPQST
ncbi:hypothetical protein NMY22_g16878 [Coprinellus aureogranulatus]|nr:hypothetical protein NMY22_g16878 [Coprinellus aureogranulatus]